jgi:DNA mismatch endonuclease (patch repair protein)
MRNKSQRESHPHAFCSVACTNAWQRSDDEKARKRSVFLRLRGRGKMLTCEMCGKRFYAPMCRVKNYNVRFCSSACRSRTATKTCPVCGKQFTRPLSGFRGGNSTCSRRCRALWNVAYGKKSNTSLEVAGNAILDRIGIAYVKQQIVGNRFVVDALFPLNGLIVQWDGDFWHGNPATNATLTPIQKQNVGRDKRCNAYLAACGYRVLRFWESDVHGNPPSVESAVRSALDNSAKT